MNHSENLAKSNALASYFDVKCQYYAFLKEKLGDKFRGDSDKANGQINISHGVCWQHLASLENRLKLRAIALECMAGAKVFAICRHGNAKMTGVIDFPYLIETPGGEDEFKWFLWDFNEVLTVWTAGPEVTEQEAIEYNAMAAEQTLLDDAMKSMQCFVEFDSEW